MRGEDHRTRGLSATLLGSPPHARGRRTLGLWMLEPTRITPACAGKTKCLDSLYWALEDHPRMRGEDPDWLHLLLPHSGSPPHARGRPLAKLSKTGSTRITPACAGKTSRSASRTGRSRDHPRMRGEDPQLLRQDRRGDGSPPHARGRLGDYANPDTASRITPACAGKTAGRMSMETGPPDHPRMRGEDCYSTIHTVYIRGSPPHARGRRDGLAGVRRVAKDHPRMRGEDAAENGAANDWTGSPPHARGRPPFVD